MSGRRNTPQKAMLLISSRATPLTKRNATPVLHTPQNAMRLKRRVQICKGNLFYTKHPIQNDKTS